MLFQGLGFGVVSLDYVVSVFELNLLEGSLMQNVGTPRVH